jgi:pyruvate kinase
MLESMMRSPRPTRAEASDVANAIFDMTDAVMLSGETAVGQYPVEAVRMMTRIAEAAEETQHTPGHAHEEALPIPAAMTDAAVGAADDVGAAALVVFTISGNTARLLAQRRPHRPIYAFSPEPVTCRRLAMVWGVEARPIAMARSVARLAAKATDDLRRRRVVKRGDVIVLVAGETPASGATNVIKVIEV